MSIVVNLFAGPGAGKSTVMAGLFYYLKKAGIIVEMAPEFAKDLVWQKSINLLKNQLYVVAEQYKRIRVLVEAEVQVIVCDSPFLLGTIYDPDQSESLLQVLIDKHEEFNNVNYVVERPQIFSQEGRVHTEDQSLLKDQLVLDLFERLDIPFSKISSQQESIIMAVHDIVSLLENNNEKSS